MTLRLPTSLLLGCAALLLLATTAQAQITRPSNSLYIELRGGATAYGGELDRTGDFVDENDEVSQFGYLTRDFGYAFGGEIGYLFTESLGFGIGALYGNYPNLDNEYFLPDVEGNRGVVNPDNETLVSATAAFRYMPFTSARISPYVNLGGQLTFGGDNRPTGYGPTVGLGFDIALSSQFSLFLEGESAFIFPDDAVDNLDPSNTTGYAGGDDTAFDHLLFYGGGLRYAFKAPYTEVMVTDLQCPAEATAGRPASFMVMTNEDATPPVSASWDWGDGSAMGSGMSASHTFAQPGTYTVTATAAGDYNQDTESCTVTVVEPPIPPALTQCRATPMTVAPGEAVSISSRINDDAIEPVEISVDYGDGTTGTDLSDSHTYDEIGTYTVTITASNEYGSDSCSFTVRVADPFCEQVTELNSVFFEYGSATVTADARGRLDENLEILNRCDDIDVEVRGYSDGQEGDALRISQQRADAVRDYYITNDIDEDRVTARGLGEDPNANPKEDPGRGDSRARRADSIPMDSNDM